MAPLGVSLWNTIKAEVCILLDLFFIIPINLIILIRNAFPGKWNYRSFSWPYIKYVSLWLWRGEAPSASWIVMQRLVAYLLTVHFRRRLLLVRRSILLMSNVSEEKRKSFVGQVDALLEQWGSPRFITGLFTYVMPASAFVLEIYKTVQPDVVLPAWTGQLVLAIFSYSLLFVTSSFLTKRGLMLGGSGRDTFFPGSLAGDGGYAKEREILKSLGLTVSEFPLDLGVLVVGILLGHLQQDFYQNLIDQPPDLQQMQKEIQKVFEVVFYTVFASLCALSYFRRTRLRRQ